MGSGLPSPVVVTDEQPTPSPATHREDRVASAAPPATGPSRPGGAGSSRLAALSDRLRAHGDGVRAAPPRDRWQASTALVLAPGDHDVEVAIIERTHREDDRWSGQLAFPGGRRDANDPDLATTAAREAAEEVGLELSSPLARVAEQRARVRPGVVACYAFAVAERQPLVPQPQEVAAAWWVPLSTLCDPRNATSVRHRGLSFKAIDVQGHALWGLTLLLLERFAALVDIELATG